VKAGDTLGLIAQSVGRTVGAMAAYNNLTDVRRLAVGQVLKIPPPGYTPPAPTATAPRPTPTVTPTSAAADTPTPAITISTPVLLTPGDGAAFAGGNALIEFKWRNPGYFPAEGQNVIHIGVVSAPGVVEWRLNEPVGSATDFKAPSWLAGQAPTEFGRTYVWYVDVQSGGAPVSPPSSQWRFRWN
jgi:murein DD-endopeptidase MepM/ murein hydrolase activator NlpD